jgi:hypothetical protein
MVGIIPYLDEKDSKICEMEICSFVIRNEHEIAVIGKKKMALDFDKDFLNKPERNDGNLFHFNYASHWLLISDFNFDISEKTAIATESYYSGGNINKYILSVNNVNCNQHLYSKVIHEMKLGCNLLKSDLTVNAAWHVESHEGIFQKKKKYRILCRGD